jgi:hypothetical protein
VPVEAVIHCARHPNVETVLMCASCGTPICPKCMIVTPVGMKCRDCGTNRKSTLYQVRPERMLLSVMTALAAGMATAVIGAIGFWAIFISMAYGYFAGSMILKASGMKRGLKLEIIAGTGMVIGAIALRLLPALVLAKVHYSAISFGLGALIDPFFWIVVAITTSCAVSKIRYL